MISWFREGMKCIFFFVFLFMEFSVDLLLTMLIPNFQHQGDGEDKELEIKNDTSNPSRL
jgi:hypothetical protein